jgi:hypothetical protein
MRHRGVRIARVVLLLRAVSIAHDTAQTMRQGEAAGRKWFSKAAVKRMIRRNVIKDGYALVAPLIYLYVRKA